MLILKELGAKWFTEMSEYISNNSQFIVRGFIKAGICGALDGSVNEDNGASSEETECDYYTDDESDIGND